MQGREQTTEKKKGQKQKNSHDDSVSVELAKEEYQEDYSENHDLPIKPND